MENLELGKLFLLLIPIIILNYALVIYSIIDILKPERVVRGGSKILWILIVALVNMFGWIIYLAFGREE